MTGGAGLGADAHAADEGSPEHDHMAALMTSFLNTALVNGTSAPLQLGALSRIVGEFIRTSTLGRAKALERFVWMIEANMGQADAEDLEKARTGGRQ